ncbi:uncharacterized protein LOC116846544 [Odontomachus brunneus]|uniref:uncharacterized protein LOC116846544 n=1 Tax=Odontomachus brunneus TaxID=486640 RepID=UPI0013F26DCD|nr:uncharacterized protein LOC116846544 [Odontomachus brunneus]
MENRNAHLFRVNCVPDLFVLLLSSVMVTSLPTQETSVVDIMKKDSNLCNDIKVLYESVYIKNCTTLEYPTQFWDTKEDTLDKYLCLGVYDTAYKICKYSNHLQIPLNNVAIFNSSIEKFFPGEKSLGNTENKDAKYCEDNLQGFTLQYDKVKLYWGPLVDRLSKPHMCQRICFDMNFIFRPLCAVFAWIKSIDDEINNAPVTNHNPVPLDVVQMPDHQSVNTKLETEQEAVKKKPEVKEPKDQSHDKSKDVSNGVLNEHTQSNTEKVESDFEKSNKHETQKILNDTSPKLLDHNLHEKGKENISNVKAETNAEAPKAPDNVPSKEDINTKEVMKETNAEEADRKSEVEDTKTSTLSENTQDHYGAGNEDDDMGDTIDTDDTIPQPIETGNQNENLQEPSEQKNNVRYHNISTEGDSHFFTYFTVTTVACIACYIGYHNKQKILAIVLEGRRSRNSRGRRRPSTASYRKLDCTLEEAVTSQCNANVTHVIY